MSNSLTGWAGACVVCAVVATASAQEVNARNGKAPATTGRWKAVGEMHERREYAGGVRLNDGRILAVSGHPLPGKGSIASAELFDPKTGKWTETGSLKQARNTGNTATLLADGRVFLAGGHSNKEVVGGAEIFDPAKGQWTDAGSLRVARDPSATLLADGRVLVSGGIDWFGGDNGKTYAVCELFDPKTGQWKDTDSLHTARHQHRTVLLDDGRILAIAGYGEAGEPLASVEIFDPATSRWQPADDLPESRAWFGHLKLSDGRVLVAGGRTGKYADHNYIASAVLFDPKTGHWSTTQPMKDKRAGFAIVRLPDGQVLVAGGVVSRNVELKSCELFDPRTGAWRSAADMTIPRRNHRAALLPDGSVLVIGGSNLFGNRYLASCEVFGF